MTKPLRFDAADVEYASGWGLNCGPAAVAAIMGLTLDEIRPHLGDFEKKRYTNPTLMWQILRNVGARWRLEKPPSALPQHGLCRVQWEGPWCAPGAHPGAAYWQTHWIATQWCERRRGFGVFDVNCMNSGGWVSYTNWAKEIVPWILREAVPRASGGWHLTHVVEIAP